MARPKPLLTLSGETMLERQLRLLRRVCRTTAIVGLPSGTCGLDACGWADELPGRGPLAGIYTGLKRSRTEYNLFLGCDLPFMEARFLEHLARLAMTEQNDATVPEASDGRLQPLAAVYRRRALAAIRAWLDAGENKTSGFFPRVRCQVVPWREIARAGFAPRIFVNLNTPADYEAARRILNFGL
ncbi:MAG: molybdenum cofactor guanylyltransferase [Acidobacteriia bacterium]|nr:molybdenum cofactor guanylyltransferase [Terriglobia bacterium]